MTREGKDFSLTVLSDALNMTFGKKLRTCRIGRGMTQGMLADIAGLSRVSVANIESGRQNVSLLQLYSFARTLDVAVSELLPAPDEVEYLANVGSGRSSIGTLSVADNRFLEDARSMMVAILRSSYDDTFAKARD